MTKLRELHYHPGLIEECTIYMKDLTSQEYANIRYNIVDSTLLHVMSKRIIPSLPIIRKLIQ
jgi:hypothetical protein